MNIARWLLLIDFVDSKSSILRRFPNDDFARDLLQLGGLMRAFGFSGQNATDH